MTIYNKHITLSQTLSTLLSTCDVIDGWVIDAKQIVEKIDKCFNQFFTMISLVKFDNKIYPFYYRLTHYEREISTERKGNEETKRMLLSRRSEELTEESKFVSVGMA